MSRDRNEAGRSPADRGRSTGDVGEASRDAGGAPGDASPGPNRRYRALFETSPLGVVISRGGEVLEANPSFLEIFGFDAGDELRGRPLTDFVAAGDRRQVAERAVRREEGEGVPDAYEITARRPDGSTFPAFVRATRIEIAGGPVNVAFISDISDRKAADRALKRAQFVVEHTDDAVFWFEPDGRFFHVNEAACTTLGYTREELLQLSVQDIDPEFDGEVLWEALRQTRSSGFRVFTSRHRRKDGSEFPVEITSNYLSLDDEEIFCAFARDISERVAAQEALRRSEEKYRSILESIEDGYYECDLTGTLTFFNDAFAELMDVDPDDLTGVGYRELLEETNAQRVFEAFNTVYRTGESMSGFELELDGDDGPADEGRWLEASISLIRDDAGEPEGFRGIVRDVTLQKSLEEQLRQAQKLEAVGELAGGVAHDFNNLLTGIAGYTQVVLSQLDDGSPLTEELQRVLRFTQRGSELTRRLLAFGRRSSLEPVELDLNRWLEDNLDVLQRMIGEDVEVAFDAADELPEVEVDPGQLEQVLLNLVVNARDAMPEGGRLEVHTVGAELDPSDTAARDQVVEAGRYAVVSVRDTGCGMSNAVQERIFEPFYTTKEEADGSGLGLPMVYGIVKQHGGYILVDSEEGKGTTFEIYLPEAESKPQDDELASRRAADEDPGPLPRGSETILLVEDEDTVRLIAERVLEEHGYEVVSTAHPAAAEREFLIRSDEISLLLTDVVMPGIDGRELKDRLENVRPGLKTLFMSGYPDRSIRRRGRGALGRTRPLLSKPFTPDELIRSVREVLDTGDRISDRSA